MQEHFSPATPPVAVIEIGTGGVRLLVAKLSPEGALVRLPTSRPFLFHNSSLGLSEKAVTDRINRAAAAASSFVNEAQLLGAVSARLIGTAWIRGLEAHLRDFTLTCLPGLEV